MKPLIYMYIFNASSSSGANASSGGAMGGLSVTSCLSDFSLYIFHPYGGKKSGTSIRIFLK